MATVKGMFCAGDASGASSHKFSSGSCAEGRIIGKAAAKYVLENNTQPKVSAEHVEMWKKMIFAPLDLFKAEKAKSSDPNINPAFIRPKMFMFRLQKLMDEYAGGVSSNFTTNKASLERALELLGYLREDSARLAAEDSHELMRCWENIQRMWQAEAHVRTILFREETRWPGYYMRADLPKLDEANWKCFANCKYDMQANQWTMLKRPIIEIVK
jgi:adenylylsulfate reductase subunit A